MRSLGKPELSSQSVTVCSTPKIDESVQAAFVEILNKHFPNGIRLNSVIDMRKLEYYATMSNKCILNDTADISSILNIAGIKHGDKIYAVSTNGKQALAELFNKLLLNNNRLFYYDEFYNIHADFLQKIHIFSSGLLKTVLSEIFPSLWYYKNYCQTERNITIESEILRCFETTVTLTYDQLKYSLPYIPITSIKQALACNDDFIWVRTGVYTHLKKIEFDEVECRKICSKIEEEVALNRFTSLASIKGLSILDMNPELTETAIKDGLFHAYLAADLEKRGNIVTKKGAMLNSVVVFENFCRSHERLTLNELNDYEKEINGSVHSQLLFAAYNNMVRINRDIFVADSKIQFDVDTTDNVLARFFHSNIIPLRTVTNFISFPYIDEYPWNLFLLESYCRRFSKRFEYKCLSVNSRNVGAIFEKSAIVTDYVGILAAVVAVAPIKLNDKEVGDFLFAEGYVAQRTNSIAKIVLQARLLRERRG